jgi:voltage-gated potassium channel Kch
VVQHLGDATALIFGTTFIHFLCTLGVMHWIRSIKRGNRQSRGVFTNATVLAALILAMSLAAIFEAGLWAAFYLREGALENFEEALYFSLVTFTTLGYGDISLGEEWRLLSAFEAANGIILFGWTTALIVAVLQRILRINEKQDPPS